MLGWFFRGVLLLFALGAVVGLVIGIVTLDGVRVAWSFGQLLIAGIGLAIGPLVHRAS